MKSELILFIPTNKRQFRQLLYILCLVHSLECHVNKLDQQPTPTECNASKEHFCTYDEMKAGKIARTCMPKGAEKVGCKQATNGKFVTKICLCAKDNCNQDLETCLKESGTDCVEVAEGPGGNDTITTEDNAEATSQQGQNATMQTTKDDLNPTDDSAAPTDEDSEQPTEGGAEPTGENVETSENPAATGGNQRVVESNQLVVVLWILVTLIKSL